MRGSQENLIALYSKTEQWEREAGRVYYDKQRARLASRADAAGLPLAQVIAAFCALSPNASELSNYIALDACISIVAGKLPEDAKVMAYPMNRAKALAILRGANIEEMLKGRKVYSFYRNTLDPNDSSYVTVDGHMLGAWCNQRFTLRRNAEIRASEYSVIVEHFRSAAECCCLPAPKFQATLWLAWKRVNRILWSPQLSFEWVHM